jgi:hypothetical protein
MRKILISAVAGAALAVVPAMAAKPATAPTHPNKPNHPAHAKGMCKVKHVVGFNAKGTLIASNLTQTAGADTTSDTSDDRYSGTVEVNVTKANHKAPTGDQTYTLDNSKVSFYNDANGQPVTTPVLGDIVHVHGKIGHAPKKCPGPTNVITAITRVSFTQATPPAAPATTTDDTQTS